MWTLKWALKFLLKHTTVYQNFEISFIWFKNFPIILYLFVKPPWNENLPDALSKLIKCMWYKWYKRKSRKYSFILSLQICFLFCCSFEEIAALGNTVLSKTPDAHDVRDKMKRLDDDEKAIDELFKKRSKDLEDAYNLAVSGFKSKHFLAFFLKSNCAFYRSRIASFDVDSKS